MIRSMTGFGGASCQVNGASYSVEIRSLNNRFFKASLRLPEQITALEGELENWLRARLKRGAVSLAVDLKDDSDAAAHLINEAALRKYLDQIQHVEVSYHGTQGLRIDLGLLLNLPGVIQQPDLSQVLARHRPVLLGLLDKACERLEAMRQEEGRRLHEALLVHLAQIDDGVDRIRQRAPVVLEDYHRKLRTRVEEMLARANLQVDQVDLIREVAIYAERCDISEELQRLGSHVEHFRQILSQGGEDGSGRTLDFLSQELLREANTIAAKSNDAAISQMVVEVKSAIDRIKEQAQNVE